MERRLEAASDGMRLYRQRMRNEQRQQILERETQRQQVRQAAMNDVQREEYREQKRNLSQQRRENMDEEQRAQNYNCSFSFASFAVKLCVSPGRGLYCFRIQGQTYHTTTNLYPGDGQPQYVPLYSIEANEAMQHRMNAAQNSECSLATTRAISDVLQQINPYVELYKNMHAVKQQEVERARRDNVQERRYQQHFRRGSDIRRYNILTSNEIAAVFVGENGAPPENRDIVVYPRNILPEKISYVSCHLDPMSYPILFPHGEFG
ncbi:hypothetical protein FHG87_008543 [Trinorchestia longiramus]|nr:hypothetical protein FHG87_008543 [Trinorchestia longiramus]